MNIKKGDGANEKVEEMGRCVNGWWKHSWI